MDNEGGTTMTTETAIDVRYPDTDAMGIVHHAVYPVWYEIARMDFFAHMGFSYEDMHALGINPPLVELDLRYKAPARYPGTVTVTTRMTAYAPKKLELTYETWFQGQLCGTARTFHIWTGPDGKSLDLSQNLPEVYQKIQNAYEG
jgi:acyl-CoA thioester hydrolase